MSAICIDCGMDTEPWPPLKGTQEHYIVRDEIWAAAGMPRGRMDVDDHLGIKGGGILCVGCLEKRLGRLLTREDFSAGPHGADASTFKVVISSACTPRLLSRLGVDPMAVAGQPLPWHVAEPWIASILKLAIKDTPEGKGLVDVEVDEHDLYLLYKGNDGEHEAVVSSPKTM